MIKKIVIDPNAVDLTDSVHIRPDRLYRCDACNRTSQRKHVRKDAQGQYHCKSCNGQVRDITDSPDGQQLAGILGL